MRRFRRTTLITVGCFSALVGLGLARKVNLEPQVWWLFAAIAAGAGMLLPAIAGWFAWPANLLLTYMLDVARLLSGIPGIFLHRSVSMAGMVGLYALILITFLLTLKRKTPKTGIITDVKPQEM